MARTRGRPRILHRPVYEPEPLMSWEELPVICNCGDLARLFKCTAEKIQRMAKGGELPAFRVGPEWRFRKEDIAAYVTRQVMGAPQGKGAVCP